MCLAEIGRLHQNPLRKSAAVYEDDRVLVELGKKLCALQVVWEKGQYPNADGKD
jgi:hypothetical protein